MEIEELKTNFYSACVHWANIHGDPNMKCLLRIDGENFHIDKWESPAPKPHIEDLLNIMPEDVKKISRFHAAKIDIKGNIYYRLLDKIFNKLHINVEEELDELLYEISDARKEKL